MKALTTITKLRH